MTRDALDPGPNGDFPDLPRNPDGTLDTVRMPTTPHWTRVGGRRVLIDPTPTVVINGEHVRVTQIPPPT